MPFKSESNWNKLDLLATIPIFISGSVLHFAFGWLGEWPPAALFAAVNESVWEHLKLAFWPAMFWAWLQLHLGRPSENGYWAARGFGLLAISIVIVCVFYAYTALLGRNLLLLDVATFAIATLIGQTVSIFTLNYIHRKPTLRLLGLVALFVQIGAFSALSYAPPHLPLFEDSRNGLYGLSAYNAYSRVHAD